MPFIVTPPIACLEANSDLTLRKKLAKGSRWSRLDTHFYHKMLSFPLQLLMPDDSFPRINDCIYGQEKLDHSDVYEFAWYCYRDEAYAAALQAIYRNTPRQYRRAAVRQRTPLTDVGSDPAAASACAERCW